MLRAVIKMRYLWQRPHHLRGDKLEKFLGPLTSSSLQVVLRDYVLKPRASK